MRFRHTTLVILLVVYSLSVKAGGYYQPQIDTYDQETGLYYRIVTRTGEPGFLGNKNRFVSNINVFNAITNESRLIFPSNSQLDIVNFLFESTVKDGSVLFNTNYSDALKNNVGIEDRLPKDKLLIVLRSIESSDKVLYSASKDGTNLKLIRIIDKNTDWHLDVKRSTLRFVTQGQNSLAIESVAW